MTDYDSWSPHFLARISVTNFHAALRNSRNVL